MKPNSTKPGSGAHMLRGSAWMIGLRWALRGIGVISTVVLARLLTPSDFGVVAIAMIVVGLFEMLNENGQGSAIIRHEAPVREHYDTAWTIQMLIGVGIAISLFFVAPLTRYYFHEPRSILVIQCLALRALLGGLQNIGVVDFRRDLKFNVLFNFQVYTKLLSFTLTVGFALLLRNYWALVIGTVGGQAVRTALSYIMHPYRPRLSLAKTGEIWSYSIWTFMRAIATYLQNQVDNIGIGGVAGAAAMGRYTVAKDVGSSPTSEITEPMIQALFPVMAKYRSDPKELRKLYLQTLGWSAMICASTGVGVAMVAPDMVQVVLGSQWLAVVPFLGWLALGTATETLRSGAYTILDVLGLPHVSARMQWLRLVLLAAAILPVAYLTHSLVMVSIARFVMAALFVPTLFSAVGKHIGVTVGLYLSALWRPFTSAAVMALAVAGLNLLLPFTGVGRLLLDILMGVVSYGGSILLFWELSGRPQSAERDLLTLLERLQAKLRRSPLLPKPAD